MSAPTTMNNVDRPEGERPMAYCTLCGEEHREGRHTNIVVLKDPVRRSLGDWLLTLVVALFTLVAVLPTAALVAFVFGVLALLMLAGVRVIANMLVEWTCMPGTLWCFASGESMFLALVVVGGIVIGGWAVVVMAKDYVADLRRLPGTVLPPPASNARR